PAIHSWSTLRLTRLPEPVHTLVCDTYVVVPADIALSVEDVVLTTGSQQLLYLLGEALFDPGDIVITEAPSYFVYHTLLTSPGVRVRTVPMDDGGMDVDALESVLGQLDRNGESERVKLI